MATGPDTGLSFTLPWGFLDWALSGIVASGIGVAAWVWRLGSKVDHLEAQNEELNEQILEAKGEIKQMQQIIRSLGSALDRKLDAQVDKLGERMDRVTIQLDDVRKELPSRQFIEGQLDALTNRVDNLINLKLAGRQ